MAHTLLKQVQDALWPPNLPGWLKVWAVLDSARDRRIYPAVIDCYLNKCCLYSGDLPSELQLTAPYLIELDRDDRFTRYIINQGWGNSWGIFFRTNAGMERLRRHLREFLVVKDQGGKRLIFRYYDPRVLRVYLPTCFTRELQTVFGPIEHFLVEGEDSATLIQFGFDDVALSEEIVRLQSAVVDRAPVKA
jgi:Domain of unknown function (DUF4123)